MPALWRNSPAPPSPPSSPNTNTSRILSDASPPTPSCCSPAIRPIPSIGRFYQTVNERITAISSHLIFFSLELNRIDDAVLEAKLADPALARYRPWLRDLRVFRPHQLSDDLEKLTHERDLTASAAWVRLFDETVAAMRIDCNGETLTVSDTLNRLSDRDRTVRETAGKAVGKAFGDNIRLFSLITNTLAKDKEIEDTWRHYPRPTSFRNRANMVEDEVVDALATAVGASPTPASPTATTS